MRRLVIIWKTAKLILTAKRCPRTIVVEPHHSILVIGDNGWRHWPAGDESDDYEQTKLTSIFAVILKRAANGDPKAEELLQQGMNLLVEDGTAVRSSGVVSASIH